MSLAIEYAEKADARLANGRLDLVRMRRDRHAKLLAQLADRHLDAILLITSGNVLYASGMRLPAVDGGRAVHQRTAVLVVAGERYPHIFTSWPELAPGELPPDHVHPPLWPDNEAGVADLVRRVGDLVPADAVVGVDDSTFAMHVGLPRLAPGWQLKSATPLLVAARLHKTEDEVECMWRAWLINEAANAAAEELVRPGVRLTELVGTYYRRLYELGATCNFLDPVFQVMPSRIADGPWSTNGDVPFALITTDQVVGAGDVIWTDTVMGYEGYSSDVGRTWFVDRPTATQRSLYEQWSDITQAVLDAMKPGVSGAELCALATELNGGRKPWLDHYFLGHTLGLEGGEQQRFGSDLGPEADEKLILEPGMAVVIEPITWADGECGYRCEELVIITDDGAERVSSYPDTPFL
ncbi:MAG TPA: Xaa-Pro peptidase family protein [Mycobacteriales bacterium]|nr:Xaa-Pro peptidase family protein [Mycobacteriales bacterium]